VRPAHGREADSDDAANVLRGVVRDVIYLGSMRRYVVALPDGTTARAQVQAGQAGDDLLAGADVELRWAVRHGVLVADEDAVPAQSRTPLEEPLLEV
jgi:hypothetical protein